jgi:hypothetical protein
VYWLEAQWRALFIAIRLFLELVRPRHIVILLLPLDDLGDAFDGYRW